MNIVSSTEWEEWLDKQGRHLERDVTEFVSRVWYTVGQFTNALEEANRKLSDAESAADELRYADYDEVEVE